MASSNKLHPIMFVGTGSDVGKSIICTAFGRVFLQDGYQPAPFKAQNMSLNSYATPDGLEIGRAQAVQAEACGVDCHVDMNPVLLKPTTDQSAQVILNGKPIGNQTAREYFLGKDRGQLFAEVCKAFNRLQNTYNPVVLEGAGSISELNLKDKDIVNMRMAKAANAHVYLIADIDKGGVFASLYGSMMLLDEEERALIKGVIINKFRGDESLFDEGRKMIEDLCKVPVIGVLPYFRDIYIEEEDSASLKQRNFIHKEGKLPVAVVLLDKMSNFTDFNHLERHPQVNLYYTDRAEDIEEAEIILLPGSKNTISDLNQLKAKGLDTVLKDCATKGKSIIGICGGYQMMGEVIIDPMGIEGNIKTIEGLGLLPIETTITNEKRSCQSHFDCLHLPQKQISKQKAYEIHMGESILKGGQIMNVLTDGVKDGCYLSDKLWGTYLHGILDNPAVISMLLSPYITIDNQLDYDHEAFKEEQYDKLADLFRQHIDFNQVYKDLKKF